MRCAIQQFLILMFLHLTEPRRLVVFLLDGVRWNYIDLLPVSELGGFRYFRERGVRTEYVEPIFPATSYPSWVTVSTGLYPESHGIIGNQIYDPNQNISFDINDNDLTSNPIWWQDIEPIWITATKAKLKVATIEWSRSDLSIHGVTAEAASGFKTDGLDIGLKFRIALKYLAYNYTLVLVHFREIEFVSTLYGPASDPVMKHMKKIGEHLDYFFEEFHSRKYSDDVAVVLLSNYGMVMSCKLPKKMRQIVNKIKEDAQRITYEDSIAGIYAKPGLEEKIFNELSPTDEFDVYRKEDIPESFHYRRAKWVPDVLVLDRQEEAVRTGLLCTAPRGVHGQNSSSSNLRGMFTGYGDYFYPGGVVMEHIRLVDVYQMLCHILDLKPQPHNGSWNNVKYLIASENKGIEDLIYSFQRVKFTNEWYKRFDNVRKGKKNGSTSVVPPLTLVLVLEAIAVGRWWCRSGRQCCSTES